MPASGRRFRPLWPLHGAPRIDRSLGEADTPVLGVGYITKRLVRIGSFQLAGGTADCRRVYPRQTLAGRESLREIADAKKRPSSPAREISLFSRQCLGQRRIPPLRILRQESRAWNR